MNNQPKKELHDPNEPIVLLVDSSEESLYRDARILRASYRVRTVASGLHALQVLESKHVGLVITEQEMHGIKGLGLLQIIKERWTKIRRVIATRAPRGELVMQAKMTADARTLIRPVPPEKLLAVVKEELDAYRS